MVDPQVFHHTVLPYNLIYYYFNQIKQMLKIFVYLPHQLLILKLTSYSYIFNFYKQLNHSMNNSIEKLSKEQQPSVQKFSDIIAYILQNVLIDPNITQTSYFPSRHKIKRVFDMYTEIGQKKDGWTTNGNVQSQNQEDYEGVNYEYILCYIMIKQYKRCYGEEIQQFSGIIQKYMREREQISHKLNCKLGKWNKNFTIHESSLINLLTKLIRVQCGKKDDKKDKNQTQNASKQGRKQDEQQCIYDFNQIENDSHSILFYKI